ncbi:hypothetical protein EDD11_009736, partial [Mortierella claussenii]
PASDGEVEKKQTHADRHQCRQKALIKAAAAVSNLESRFAIRDRPNDAVISGDNGFFFYKTVPVVWRPVGSYKSRRFVPFEKNVVLESLGLSTQLTALAILSRSNYITNIPYLAIESNHNVLKILHGGVEAKPVNSFATIDKQDPANVHQYRPRFNPKIRFEPSKEQSAPATLMQYTLKPGKEPPEKSDLPAQAKRKATVPVKPETGGDDRFECRHMLSALPFEHPTVSLDLDRLSHNFRAVSRTS